MNLSEEHDDFAILNSARSIVDALSKWQVCPDIFCDSTIANLRNAHFTGKENEMKEQIIADLENLKKKKKEFSSIPSYSSIIHSIR